MTQTRVPFANLQSYQPAVDFHKTGSYGVIDGRNFGWSANGVHADYASRLVSLNNTIGPLQRVAKEIRLRDGFHVLVGEEVYEFTPAAAGNPVGTWALVDSLAVVQKVDPIDVPAHFRGATSTNLGGFNYLCTWNNGVYRIELGPVNYVRLTQGTVPGFPDDSQPVISIAEARGRQLYLTETTLYWSNTNAPEDLVPALGGAGFQVLNEITSGDPRAITATDTGVIVWTTGGAIVAEFVGGDLTFRFYELLTQSLPAAQSAIVRVPDGSILAIARLGLYRIDRLREPELIAPLFSEFLRDYLRSRPVDAAYLWYSPADNRLYISLRGAEGSFFETFVLDVGLDRWGTLNRPHRGLFHYTSPRGPFAYMDSSGVVSYFLPKDDDRRNREIPTDPPTLAGLDSMIEIGYIRSEQVAVFGDSVQEIQEITVYRSKLFQDRGALLFDEGIIGTPSATVFDEGTIGDTPATAFDEGSVAESLEDLTYRLSARSDLFTGTAYDSIAAYLAQQGSYADTWTCNLPGHHFTLRFEAIDANEYFRVNAGDCTMTTAGQAV